MSLINYLNQIALFKLIRNSFKRKPRHSSVCSSAATVPYFVYADPEATNYDAGIDSLQNRIYDLEDKLDACDTMSDDYDAIQDEIDSLEDELSELEDLREEYEEIYDSNYYYSPSASYSICDDIHFIHDDYDDYGDYN